MGFAECRAGFRTDKSTELFSINQLVSFSRVLNLVVSAALPLAWMSDCAGSNHIHVDVDDALPNMLAALNCCGVVAVLPEGAFPAFSLIELLPSSSGNQLNRPADGLRFSRIFSNASLGPTSKQTSNSP